jgi:predicted MFS family arabinose efflux permease
VSSPSPAEQATLPARVVWALAVGCGITVANLYYAQPLLPTMAHNLGVSEERLGVVSALTQVGYALGLFLIVPLGDALERRRLLLSLLAIIACALIAVALSPGIEWLAAASFALGVATVVPQLLVPFAASLAGPKERGWVVGRVMSGLIIGLLASRTFSGFVGAHAGWRVVFEIAAVLTVLLAAVYAVMLPTSHPTQRLTYWQLIRSFGRLLTTEPVLRQSCLFGAAAFGAFSVFWTTLAFHLARPPFEFGSTAVGLFGLAGIGGALAAPLAGKVADRRGSMRLIGIGLAMAGLAFALFAGLGDNLAGLVLGVLLLDFGVQSAHISNQSRIYSLPPEMHNRLNSVYMVAFFLGGAAGSSLGTYGWCTWGWPGVCAVGAIFALVGLAGFAMFAVRAKREYAA